MLAVLVMAFGNAGFAQHRANLKSEATQNVLKHYGVRDEITVVPDMAMVKTTDDDLVRVTYTYDEYDYYLTEEMYALSSGTEWNDLLRITYEYDFFGNVLEKLSELNLGNGNWMNAELYTYSYEGGELSEVIYQDWDGFEWQNDEKQVYTYNGDVTTVLYWFWNGNNWASDELWTYTYENGYIEVLKQYMEGGAWQNDEKDTYMLDFDEHVTEILVEGWVGTSWVNDKRTTYNYEDEVYTSQLVEDWNGASWESAYMYRFVYDNGNATQGKCTMMSGGEWVPADGDIEMAYGYNAATKIFEDCHIVDMTYVDLTGVNENTQASFKVYPMPAENEIQIQAEDFQKAEIYSVTGQKLMESQQQKMNVSALSQGVYLLKVYDQSGKAETQRIVVK